MELLAPGAVHRASKVIARAGGKSFIVARTMRRRGGSVRMYGFLGDPIGTLLSDECRQLGISDLHTPIADATRITVVIVESATGQSTVLNEPGPLIRPAEYTAFRTGLLADIRQGDIVVCTGSLPRGVDNDLYAWIVREASDRGAFVAVDASGTALSLALDESPWVVKCNRHEFTGALGMPTSVDESDMIDAMLAQTASGTAVVVVTMGPASFLVATEREVWRVGVPPIEVVNATGSGDTFLGCFVSAVVQGSGLADALRDGTAGGVVNAGQLEPGLEAGAALEPFRSRVTFELQRVQESTR
jgi:1-phosphofructokinase family hexose kinase